MFISISSFKVFGSVLQLRIKMENQSVKCSMCDKLFSRIKNMKRHRMNCDVKRKIHLCSCGKSFTRSDNLRRHKKSCHGVSASVPQAQPQAQPQVQPQAQPQAQPLTSTQQLEEENIVMPSTSAFQPESEQEFESEDDVFNDSFEECLTPRFLDYIDNHVTEDNWYCTFCKVIVDADDKLRHLQSSNHKDNAKIKLEQDVYLIASCFGDKVLIFRIENADEQNLSLATFLEEKKLAVLKLLKEYTTLHKCITFQLEVRTTFSKPGLEEEIIEGIFYINHAYTKLTLAQTLNNALLEKKMEDIFKQMCSNIEEITMKGSNWALTKIHHLDLHINKKESLLGAAFIDLPLAIRRKGACINPLNNDTQCFKWCIKAFFLFNLIKDGFNEKLNQIKTNEYYTDQQKKVKTSNEYNKLNRRLSKISPADEALVDASFTHLSFEGMEFPMKLEDIEKFIQNNPEISINVFGINADDENSIVGPLYSSEREAEHNIFLLFLSNDVQSHYCWIKDISRLAARKRRIHRNRQFYCTVCLLAFNSEEKLESHRRAGCLGK